MNTELQLCPQVSGISYLDASEYLGVWYEQTRVNHEFFQSSQSVCTQALYFDLESDGSFWVLNSTQDSIEEDRTAILGMGKCTSGNGDCFVSFNQMTPQNPNYIILDTDYYTYSMVYTCQFGKQFFWLLSRDSNMDPTVYQSLLDNAKTYVPSLNLDSLIDQEYQGSNCTYMQSKLTMFLQ